MARQRGKNTTERLPANRHGSGKRQPQKRNQTSWKPNESGNPSGRPANEYSLTPLLRRALQEARDDGKPRGVALMEKLIELGDAGNVHAIKTILDRVDGMPGAEVPEEPVTGEALFAAYLREHADDRARFLVWYAKHGSGGNGA